MKNKLTCLILILVAFSKMVYSQNTTAEPWKAEQLLAPAVLDSVIKHTPEAAPLVICVGPSALIKGSVDVGSAKEKTNLNKLKHLLSKQKKSREVVIYCGCCPFDKCPNVRPAFQLLNKMKFTNSKLLNLPKNLKADWIDHGYIIND